LSFWMPGTAGSAKRYSTAARASAAGRGVICGAGVELSDADVDGGAVSGDASCLSPEHPESPSAAAKATALKTAVRCRLIQPRQWPDERTDWISVIAESCDSFQPP
jgi:hypothetical protein